MLLDEPTSAMDPRSERLFVARMKEYTDGKTLVVVTHRKPILALVSRVWLLSGDKLLWIGLGMKFSKNFKLARLKLQYFGFCCYFLQVLRHGQ